ncbi:MAG: hypothetical protein EZS28_014680 [Streblomastix strix]|uniref:Uncharacterized protein n=1 Tax=Streblomastix strix TaxID=222440 RepID=A0A5J4W4C8_9EUKA|nr:MAG: hypothetical protein EZS28_014680 [Streblomastix strix]
MSNTYITTFINIRDIASGKSKAYVFDTQSDLNDWMTIQDNVAKHAIGDNLYIVDKQVVDYRGDGNDLKVLETEQSDMTNVITTLGTATGGAGGGVKAIQDITASVDLLNYYNKSQTYSQTETDQKLSLKQNISDQIDTYAKTQDDALLLLKADKTELIDVYTKIEVDALLDDKLNVREQINACTKGEDDSLLLLKADKIQLIDSYIKGESNNLQNNKANSAISYTKGEDDALLLLKADKTELIDEYINGESINFLNNKADSGVSYTKGEDYALLLMANQSTTYIKTETDQIISQIDAGDVDLRGYMTLGTSQTITANKTFNNAC